MASTWLDLSFQTVMSYIERTQGYLTAQAKTLAVVVFVLSLGIALVKVALGAGEFRQVIVKHFIAIIIYFVAMFLFPQGMKGIQRLTSEWAYGAIVAQGVDFEMSTPKGSAKDFSDWLVKIGGGVWSKKKVNDPGYDKDMMVSLDFKITNGNTGIISINKLMKLIIITFDALRIPSQEVMITQDDINETDAWGVPVPKMRQKIGIFDRVFAFLIAIVYAGCMIMVAIKYVMCYLEFTFISAMGVLFIPLSLWEGTKYLFEKLIGSIVNVSLKLFIITVSIYLTTIIMFDNFKHMYMLSIGEPLGMQRTEYYVTVVFVSLMATILVQHSDQISEFLSGGQPRMSYGEFAQASASMGAAAATGGGLMMGAAKMAGGGALHAGAALGAAARAGGKAYNSAMDGVPTEDMSAGQQFMVGMGAAASGMGGAGNSLVRSLGKAGTSALSAVPGAYNNASKAMGNFARTVSPVAPISAEGIGRFPGTGGGGAGGGGGGGAGGFMGMMSGGVTNSEATGPGGAVQKADSVKGAHSLQNRMESIKSNFMAAKGKDSGSDYTGETRGIAGGLRTLGGAVMQEFNDYADQNHGEKIKMPGEKHWGNDEE